MQITLFNALKSIKISDEQPQVINAAEEYIAVKTNEANKGIEAQLSPDGLIRPFGLITAIAAAGAFTKLVH